MVCWTEDYISARKKCVLAQLTSDLDTEVTDVERSKSRARRQRSQFRLVDDVEPDDHIGMSAPSPPRLSLPPPPTSLTPKASSVAKAAPSITPKPPPPPPASLTPKSVNTAVPSTTSVNPKAAASAASLSRPPPPPASLTAEDVSEHVPLQQGNIVVVVIVAVCQNLVATLNSGTLYTLLQYMMLELHALLYYKPHSSFIISSLTELTRIIYLVKLLTFLAVTRQFFGC